MADEITANVTLKCPQSGVNFVSGTLTSDQASLGGGNPGLVSIGTSQEDIAFGDVTPGMVVMQNMDTTNYVQYGPKNGSSVMQGMGVLKPHGEVGSIAYLFLDAGVVIRAVANTAACKVNITSLNP
jgi:hypothetical protein